MPAPSAPADVSKGTIYFDILPSDGSSPENYVATATLFGLAGYDGAFTYLAGDGINYLGVKKVHRELANASGRVVFDDLPGNDRIVPTGNYWLIQQSAAKIGKAIEIAAQQVINARDVVDDDFPTGGSFTPSRLFFTTFPVRFATTTNDSLSGLAARDGVTPVAGDLVLAKDQSAPATNGIYVAASGAWARSSTFDLWADFPGSVISVSFGTANAGSLWRCTAATGGTLGTTAIPFSSFTAGSSGLVVGTTTITSGTSGRVLSNNAGVLGDLDLSAVYQAKDATLTAFAALTIAANSLTIGSGSDAFSQTTFAANTFPARASTGNLVAKTITDFGLSLVDDTTAAAARSTLQVIGGGTTSSFNIFVPRTKIISASNVGAHLDADPLTGGGTDDYAILQAILDSAPEAGSIELHIEASYLLSNTLKPSSNTTIIHAAGHGAYLANSVSEPMFMNKHWTRGHPDSIVRPDSNIAILGGFLNGNNLNQAGVRASYSDGSVVGLNFNGVQGLTLEGFEIRNARRMGCIIANASGVRVKDLRFNWTQHVNTDAYAGVFEDGVHINGPVEDVLIEGTWHNGGDDAVGLNLDEVRQASGPIQAANSYGAGKGIRVHDTYLEGSSQGVRVISTLDHVDAEIDGIHGTFQCYAFRYDDLGSTTGHCGRVSVRDVDALPVSGGNPHFGEDNTVGGSGLWTVFSIIGQGDHLSISEVTANGMADARPAFYFGPTSHVGLTSFNAISSDATPSTPGGHTTYGSLQLASGAYIGRAIGDFFSETLHAADFVGPLVAQTINGNTHTAGTGTLTLSTFTLTVTGTTSVNGTNTGDNATNSQYSGIVSNATHTGDATGATALTLATVNSNVGTFGSATKASIVTVNAKGLVTAVSESTVTPAVGSITGLGTGSATALAAGASAGGNGTSDSGKLVKFGSTGYLTITDELIVRGTGSSDGYIQLNNAANGAFVTIAPGAITANRAFQHPDAGGTYITTGNLTDITAISGATINNSVIGGTTPAAVTATVVTAAGGSTKLRSDGVVEVASGYILLNNTAGVQLHSSFHFGFCPGNPASGGPDVILVRDAANTLAMRNASAEQELRLGSSGSYVAIRSASGILQGQNFGGSFLPFAYVGGPGVVISGNFTATGTATTTFTVTIGVTMANSTYEAVTDGNNALSSAVHYVNNKTTTTFDVVYLAGLTGAVAFDWIVSP